MAFAHNQIYFSTYYQPQQFGNPLVNEVIKHYKTLKKYASYKLPPRDEFLHGYDANVIQGAKIIAGKGPGDFTVTEVNGFVSVFFNETMPVKNIIALGAEYFDYTADTKEADKDKYEFTVKQLANETLHDGIVRKRVLFHDKKTNVEKEINVTRLDLDRSDYLKITPNARRHKPLAPEDLAKRMTILCDLYNLTQRENVFIHCSFGISRTGFMVLMLEFMREYDRIFASNDPAVIAKEVADIVTRLEENRNFAISYEALVGEALQTAIMLHRHALGLNQEAEVYTEQKPVTYPTYTYTPATYSTPNYTAYNYNHTGESLVDQVARLVTDPGYFRVDELPKDAFLHGCDANVIKGTHMIAGAGPQVSAAQLNRFLDVLFNKEMPVNQVISLGVDYVDYCHERTAGGAYKYSAKQIADDKFTDGVTIKEIEYQEASTGEVKRVDVLNIPVGRGMLLDLAGQDPDIREQRLDTLWKLYKIIQEENIIIHCASGMDKTGIFVLTMELVREHDRIYASGNPDTIAREIETVLQKIRQSRRMLVLDVYSVREAIRYAEAIHDYGLKQKQVLERKQPAVTPAAKNSKNNQLIDQVIKCAKFTKAGNGKRYAKDKFVGDYDANLIIGANMIAAAGPVGTNECGQLLDLVFNTVVPVSKIVALDITSTHYLYHGKFNQYTSDVLATHDVSRDIRVSKMEYTNNATHEKKVIEATSITMLNWEFLKLYDNITDPDARREMEKRLDAILKIYEDVQKGNVLVHCNYGLGRAGAFVLMMEIMRDYDRIFASGKPQEIARECEKLLEKLRISRAGMVQTPTQFTEAIRCADVLHRYALTKKQQLQNNNVSGSAPLVRKQSGLFAPSKVNNSVERIVSIVLNNAGIVEDNPRPGQLYLSIMNIPKDPAKRLQREQTLDVLWKLGGGELSLPYDPKSPKAGFIALTVELLREYDRIFDSGSDVIIAKEIANVFTKLSADIPEFGLGKYNIGHAVRAAEIIHQYGMEKQLRDESRSGVFY